MVFTNYSHVLLTGHFHHMYNIPFFTLPLFYNNTALTPDRISSEWAYECHSRPIHIDRKVMPNIHKLS